MIKILYSLPTILHLGQDFSNLSRTQYSIMSVPSGCTNLVAYVTPGDQTTFGATPRMHLSHLLNSQTNISLYLSANNAQPNKIDCR